MASNLNNSTDVEIIEVVSAPTAARPHVGVMLSDGSFIELDQFPAELRSEGFLAKLRTDHYLSLMR